MRELANLNLLRATAVLFVFVDHTFNVLLQLPDDPQNRLSWLGRLGVLFFFVHTCCVLMMSLDRHRGSHLFARFYVRRAFRIYPLSMAAVLAVAALGLNPHVHGRALLANLGLVQNLTFSAESFPSIWTLPVEVQMYGLLPFLFVLIKRFPRFDWALMLGVFAVVMPVAAWQHTHIARASVLRFAPDFVPGALAYCLIQRRKAVLPAWSFPVLLTAVSVGFLLLPGWGLSAWAACLALGASMPWFRQIELGVVNRTTATVAKYSFGIYVVHSLALMWMHPTWQTLPGYVILVAVMSVLGYHLVEHPIMRLGSRLTATRNVEADRPLAHKGSPGSERLAA